MEMDATAAPLSDGGQRATLLEVLADLFRKRWNN